MQSLKIRDQQTGDTRDIGATRIVFGRGDDVDVVANGAKAGLASGRHAELTFSPGTGWTLADLGSTNGTFLNGQRITAPQRVKDGDTIALALNGPRYTVVLPPPAKTIVDRGVDADATLLIGEEASQKTMLDHAGLAAEAEAEAGRRAVVLRRPDGTEARGSGQVVVLGRDPGCTIPLRTGTDKIVSSRHAEIRFADDGSAVLADLDSRNGTFLGGKRVKAPVPLKAGDSIRLGEGGPDLFVARLGAAQATAPAAPPPAAAKPRATPRASEEPPAAGAPDASRGPAAGPAPEAARPADAARASAGARAPRGSLALMVSEAKKKAQAGGTLMFAAAMAEQLSARSTRKLRWIVAGSAITVVVIVGLVYVLAMRRVRAVEREAEEARAALTAQVEDAMRLRQRGDEQIQQLVRQLAEARRRSAAPAVTEGLRRQVAVLRSQDSTLQASMSAVRSLDLPAIVRANRGFVTAVQAGRRAASGFLVSDNGYVLTSSGVLRPDSGQASPDSALVYTSGEPTRAHVADVLLQNAGPAGDVAILKVRGYSGQRPPRLNWYSSTARVRFAIVALGFRDARRRDEAGPPRWYAVTATGAIAAVDSAAAHVQLLAAPPLVGAPLFDGSGALIGIVTSAGQGGTPSARITLLRELGSFMPDDLRAHYNLR